MEFCLHFHMSEEEVGSASSRSVYGGTLKHHNWLLTKMLGIILYSRENTQLCALRFPKCYHVINTSFIILNTSLFHSSHMHGSAKTDGVDKEKFTWTKAQFLMFSVSNQKAGRKIQIVGQCNAMQWFYHFIQARHLTGRDPERIILTNLKSVNSIVVKSVSHSKESSGEGQAFGRRVIWFVYFEIEVIWSLDRRPLTACPGWN